MINRNKFAQKGYRDIEYRMSKELADMLLKTKKGGNGLTNQEYLCKYVNEECGVRGNCILVTTTL